MNIIDKFSGMNLLLCKEDFQFHFNYSKKTFEFVTGDFIICISCIACNSRGYAGIAKIITKYGILETSISETHYLNTLTKQVE